MEIEFEQVDGVTVATLVGELDGRTAPIVQEKLLALPSPDGKVLLDMRGVSYISSAGLRALLMLYRQIAGNQGQVALCGLSDGIKDVMSITGFLEFFAAYDTIEEGVAMLTAGHPPVPADR
jgi:anti-sigma B factor antagonist